MRAESNRFLLLLLASWFAVSVTTGQIRLSVFRGTLVHSRVRTEMEVLPDHLIGIDVNDLGRVRLHVVSNSAITMNPNLGLAVPSNPGPVKLFCSLVDQIKWQYMQYWITVGSNWITTIVINPASCKLIWTSCLEGYLMQLMECRTLWGEPEWVHVQNMEQLPFIGMSLSIKPQATVIRNKTYRHSYAQHRNWVRLASPAGMSSPVCMVAACTQI